MPFTIFPLVMTTAFFYTEINKRTTVAFPLLALLVLIFTGCGTTRIPVEVDKPSTLNTSGIKRIAVMPFETDNHSYSGLASYATSIATERIRETGRFTLVDASEIRHLQRRRQIVESYVDAMLIGRIMRANVALDSKTNKHTDKKGNVTHSTTYYTKVEIEFNYSLKMARDGRLIGPVSRRGVADAYSSDGYPSSDSLLRYALAYQLSFIRMDIAPYKSIEIRTFAKDKTDDEAVNTEMKEALAQVKAQNYKLALQAYLGIYERHKSTAAAINASILYEVLGDTESALSIMQKAHDETGNPTAQLVIARLNRILADKAKLAASEQDPLSKVTAFAIEEIQKVLSGDAAVWLYNNSPGNTMVEAVIDNLTADFIRKEIGIVDMQKLQISGIVSDAEMVRIGNAAGAKTIIIIGITGFGAMRRLQVRVLDIERGIPIMQSDTDERWQL
jgi:hypothetical protein